MFSNVDAESNLPKPLNGPGRVSQQSLGAQKSERAVAPGTSVIGNDLTILGEQITIISQNKLQVDGHVRGNVHGKQVIVSKEGHVTGKVSAETIEVRGGVDGSIRAVSVALHETARVQGDLEHQKLSISEGAEFDGRVRLIKDASALMPELDADAISIQNGQHYEAPNTNDADNDESI